MRVNSIFYSIQGEGLHSGVSMAFLRLQGCNLIPHCAYCDTPEAQDPNEGVEMSVDEVVNQVLKVSPWRQSWVCITGGEPLWQPDSLELVVRRLKQQGRKVTVETNGSFMVPQWYSLVDSWSIDMKCPSSGVCGVSQLGWYGTRFCDQIKFVVGTKEDLAFTNRQVRGHFGTSATILVSPVITVYGKPEDGEYLRWAPRWLQEVAEFCKEARVRYSIQDQKVVWGNRKEV